ncbi:autophagy protein 13 [Coemansia sp. RSA 1822]|nr:autophagy protein 13 [Coemansia sp. RSA 638]KAJ2543570.1 autophagy protein 13 [Coemansia sp. RSA 1853]KAJ2561517.1 autophagy protein 13 [Coemansia sp. RSA 1822]
MTQRPFFWTRPSSLHAKVAVNSEEPSLHTDSLPAEPGLDPQTGSSEQRRGRPVHTSNEPRLPPNSGAVTHQASSFSSHSSSSPPSISLYAGPLRNVLGRTQAGMPANIRRVDAGHRRSVDISSDAAHVPLPQPTRSSIDNARSLPHSTPAAANKDARSEQIVQNFYSKAAQVIAHLRAHRHIDRMDSESAMLVRANTSSLMYASSTSSSAVDIGSGGRRINKWFNLHLEDIDSIRDEARLWRHAVSSEQRPPPMFIDVYLDVSGVCEELQVTDVFGRPWTVDLDLGSQRASAIALESWRLDLAPGPDASHTDLPRVYKQAIVFFRSLYAFAGLLPSTRLAQQLTNSSTPQLTNSSTPQLSMFVSLRAAAVSRDNTIGLDVALTGTEQFLESHVFSPVPTPLGVFSMSVQYRRECAFTCLGLSDGRALRDSMAAVGALDNTYFTPTLSSRSGSHFSGQRRGQMASPRSTQPTISSPRSTQPMTPWHTMTAHGASLNSERSLTMPAVNPFRARPLSTGDSSSLPSYLDTRTHVQPNMASSRTSLRRISLGARTHVPDVARPHSLEQRPQRLSSSTAGDSGSVLHRSVMLRRFGDAMSPTEPQRHDSFGRSPPRGPASIRSMSSGSAGSVARSGLGVSPFKSPSLSESPALGPFKPLSGSPALGPFADTGSHDSRGLAVGHDTHVPRITDSPSSFGTSGSSHSRRLSSSFGNRRASLRRMPAQHDVANISRRHTIVEDRVWSAHRSNVHGSSTEDNAYGPSAEDNAQDIDEFIRMVDSKKPLRAYSQRSPQLPLSAGAASSARPATHSLQRYHGLLDEFDDMSRDMEDSVMLDKAPDIRIGSLPEGEMAGSPFRRVPMPNPLRNSSDRVASATSAALPAASEGSVALLQQAFDGLSIEPIPSIEPVLSPRHPHVRNAAPGLDMERERPLPRPVSILSPGVARRPRPQIDPDSDHEDAEPKQKLRGPNLAPVRGKSQPVSHVLSVGHRMATPQPISYTRGQPDVLPAIPIRPGLQLQQPRVSPDPRPFSYRSDRAAGTSQLNALLSVADDNAGLMRAPRSTPSTPSQPASTIFTRGAPQQQQQQRRQRRQENEQLRSNFPPLSFILPRTRVDQDTSSASSRSAAEDDEDLMFQMDSSLH